MKYITNHLSNELVIVDRLLEMPARQEGRELPPQLEDHPHLFDAISKGWAEVSDTPVKSRAIVQNPIKFTDPNTGMTEEELKEYLKAKSEKAEKPSADPAETEPTPTGRKRAPKS